MSANEQQLSEGQLDIIFYHGAYPLWSYLKEIIGIDITEVCPRVAKEEPVLKTDNGELVARVVDLPFVKQVDHMSNNDVIFLLNSINVVFGSLSAGIEKDGEKILGSFKFKLDENHNMILVGAESDIPVSERAIAVLKL